MSATVATNFFLHDRSVSARGRLNAAYGIHLFQNDYQPTCVDTVLAFVECNFPGYAAQSFDAAFKPPIKLQDGFYRLTSKFFSFVPSADNDQFAYGWYLSQGANVALAGRFDNPFPISDGIPLEFTIALDDIATASGLA